MTWNYYSQKTRLKNYLRQLIRMSCTLTVVRNVTLLALGAELKLKESLTARFSDIVAHLYLASAVIKYDHDNGGPVDDGQLFNVLFGFSLGRAYSPPGALKRRFKNGKT